MSFPIKKFVLWLMGEEQKEKLLNGMLVVYLPVLPEHKAGLLALPGGKYNPSLTEQEME